MSIFAQAMQGVPNKTQLEFLKYHKENPRVWQAFETYALQALKQNKRVGSMMIINRVRWEAEFERNGEFKVNNNYAPYYARVFNTKHNKEFFDLREVKEREAA